MSPDINNIRFGTHGHIARSKNRKHEAPVNFSGEHDGKSAFFNQLRAATLVVLTIQLDEPPPHPSLPLHPPTTPYLPPLALHFPPLGGWLGGWVGGWVGAG